MKQSVKKYQPVDLQEFVDYLQYGLEPAQKRALIHLLSATEGTEASPAEQLALEKLLKNEMQRFIARTSPMTLALKKSKQTQPINQSEEEL